MKRFTCAALALILILGLCPFMPASAADGEESYEGAAIAAVNTIYSTNNLIEGYFSSSSKESALFSLDGEEELGIYDIFTDEETGEVYTILEPDLPEPEPVPEKSALLRSTVSESKEYSVSDTFDLTGNDRETNNSMVCLYTGINCTVWGSVSDDEAIQLNADNAEAIGKAFDKDFDRMSAAFGTYWYDADCDGKVAIMCYDLDSEYGGGDPSSYTAGYFWMVDMISSSGYVNGVNYGSDNHINGIDCIHIDTYPAMGQEDDLFGRIENTYSTLFHEFQHMLNFSTQVKNGSSGYFSQMETYLNEAFSMAAQHYICGPEATGHRINYFNGPSYTPGTSLTCWSSTLSNYANSYLFGQYIRTRYGQKTYTDGWGLFNEVQSGRSKANAGNTLGIITELLETTPEQLILDFWTAVYKKNGTGVHGFAGEEWAKNISPKIFSSISSANSRGIYPGGAKFYLMTDTFTLASSSNVSFIPFGELTPPEVTAVGARRLSENTCRFTLTANRSGTVYYCLSPASAQSPTSYKSYSITAGSEFALDSGNLNGYSEYKIFYYVEDSLGNTTKEECITVPAWLYTITAEQSTGGTITLLDGENTVVSGDYVVTGTLITVSTVCDEGKELKALYLDGETLDENTFTVSGKHTVSARFGAEDISAADSFARGCGTAGDPYTVETLAQLKYFAQRVNSGDSMAGEYVVLSADLELDSFELETIGIDAEHPFSGSFDAKGHYISGLYKNTSAVCSGLFGYVEGTVQNLIIKDCTIINKNSVGYTGCIAAANNGTIQNCIVEGGLITADCSENGFTGAVTGQNCGTVSHCYASAEISSSGAGSGKTGGIAGENEGTISDCLVNTNITADHTGVTYAGGVAGYASGSIVSGCYVCEITITATAPRSVNAGGIAGYSGCSDISDCAVNAKAIYCFTNDEIYCSIDQIVACCYETETERCFYSAATVMRMNAFPADSDILGEEVSASDLTSVEFLKANTDLDFISVWELGTHPTLKSPTLQVMRELLGVKITVSKCSGGKVITDYETAYAGQEVTLDARTAQGFSFKCFTLDGEPLSSNCFTVSGEHTVGAAFLLTYEGAVDGGITGDASWFFTEDNELVILGEGEMEDYMSAQERPWHRYASDIEKLTLSPGITCVADFTAAGCTSLTGAYIPEGVLSLGSRVFEGSAVSEIILPSTLTSAGDLSSSALMNIFYNGSEGAWSKVNAPGSIAGFMRFGLPAAIEGEKLLGAYPINGTVEQCKFKALMADGREYELGGNVIIGEYDFSKTGSTAISLDFLGLEYEHTVTVYKDRHTDVKAENGRIAVTVYGKDIEQAIVAVYSQGKMVGIKCVTLPGNGSVLTLDITQEGCTANIFLLGKGSAPLENKKEIAL